MASASLEALTNELFERIVQCLDLHDIQRLRLVSRATAYKATQDTFRSCFRVKSVELTRPSLECFVQATSRNGLGCLVDDLSLLGVVYDPSFLRRIIETGERRAREEEISRRPDRRFVRCSEEEIRQAAHDLETLQRRQQEDEEVRGQSADRNLLREAFSNLAVYRPGGLKRLSLQISIYRDDATTRLYPSQCDCREEIFQAASKVFSLTMACLEDTQLAIHALDIFAEKPKSLACSLPCDAVRRLDFKAGLLFPFSFSTLSILSISISDRLLYEDEPETIWAQIADEEIYSGLSRMLQQCPLLDYLEISGYVLTRKDPELTKLQATLRHRYIHHLAQMEPLTHLRRLRLAGLPTQQEDLLAFLRNHRSSLRQVELNQISLGDDSFAPVFSFLASEDMGLETVHLEDLWEGGKLVQFEGERGEHGCTEISGDYIGRNVIRRWGEGTTKEVSYYFHEGMAVGSTRAHRWRVRRQQEFGGGRRKLR